MARHLRLDAFKTAAGGNRTMPEDCYVGFAVGAESEHDLFDVELPSGGTRRIAPGVVVAVDATRGQPVFTAVRHNEAVGHVVGFTCREELATGLAKRAPWVYPRTAGALVAGAGEVELPFAGRRRLALVFKNTEGAASLTVTINGRRYYEAGSYDEVELHAAQTVAAGAVLGHVEGGTNEAEAYDTIAVVIAGAGTEGFTLSAEAFD